MGVRCGAGTGSAGARTWVHAGLSPGLGRTP